MQTFVNLKYSYICNVILTMPIILFVNKTRTARAGSHYMHHFEHNRATVNACQFKKWLTACEHYGPNQVLHRQTQISHEKMEQSI